MGTGMSSETLEGPEIELADLIKILIEKLGTEKLFEATHKLFHAALATLGHSELVRRYANADEKTRRVVDVLLDARVNTLLKAIGVPLPEGAPTFDDIATPLSSLGLEMSEREYLALPDWFLLRSLVFALRRLKLTESPSIGEALNVLSQHVCLEKVERHSPKSLSADTDRSRQVLKEWLKSLGIEWWMAERLISAAMRVPKLSLIHI